MRFHFSSSLYIARSCSAAWLDFLGDGLRHTFPCSSQRLLDWRRVNARVCVKVGSDPVIDSSSCSPTLSLCSSPRCFFEPRTTFSRQPLFRKLLGQFHFFRRDSQIGLSSCSPESSFTALACLFSAPDVSGHPAVGGSGRFSEKERLDEQRQDGCGTSDVGDLTLPQKVVEEEQLHTLGFPSMSRTYCHLVEET